MFVARNESTSTVLAVNAAKAAAANNVSAAFLLFLLFFSSAEDGDADSLFAKAVAATTDPLLSEGEDEEMIAPLDVVPVVSVSVAAFPFLFAVFPLLSFSLL